MASKSVTIRDTWEAIQDGTIPGKLEERRFLFPRVSSVNSRGATIHWEIEVQLRDGDEVLPIEGHLLQQPVRQLGGRVGVIVTRSWQEGGAERRGVKPTIVEKGKNLGKKNETNVLMQAMRDALGRYNKQCKRSSSLPLPMLVKRLGETASARITPKDVEDGVLVQRKYNGVRMVALADGTLYSRTGATYEGLQCQRAELARLFAEHDADAHGPLHIDGELYKHGKSLQEISGMARATKDQGEGLEFVIFDCFMPNSKHPNEFRWNYIGNLFRAAEQEGYNCLSLAESIRLSEDTENIEDALYDFARVFVEEGYEGAIARKLSKEYQYGANNYHSSHLVKIKPLYDDEYAVVGFTQGAKGKDVGAVIWVCETKDGARFNVVPKGMSYDERYAIYRALDEDSFKKYIEGKPMTVEYPELSRSGIPTQAKAVGFRTQDDLSPDPLQLLLAAEGH